MNYYLIFASAVALFSAIGHLTIGNKLYLKPLLESKLNAVPKKVLYSVFHYISVYFIGVTVLLFMATFKESCYETLKEVVIFNGIMFILFAIVQLIIASTSKIEAWFGKMFQWILFMILGLLSLAAYLM